MTGRERREQLVGVGRAVFAEKGFDATTVEEIAERAGVTKPVVYEHFGGKEGLYAVAVDRAVNDLVGRIVTALDGAGHVRQSVEHATEAFLRFVEEERDGFRLLVRDAPIGSSRGTLPTVLSDVADKAETILGKEFADRGFDTTMAPLYARALVGMVGLVGQWWLEVGEPDRHMVAAHIINLAWNGLGGLEADPAGR